jgi:hypothetical protein
MLKLKNWIKREKLTRNLFSNPKVAEYIILNHKTDWFHLSANPSAVHILEKNLDKVVWDQIAANPNAVHLLLERPEKINDYNKTTLNENPSAIEYLEKNPQKFTGHTYPKIPQPYLF